MCWALDLEPVSTSGQPAPARCHICINKLQPENFILYKTCCSGDPPLRPDQRQWHSHVGLLGWARQLCRSRHSQGIRPGAGLDLLTLELFQEALCKDQNTHTLAYSQIWDVAAAKRVNVLSGHSARWDFSIISSRTFVSFLQSWSVESHPFHSRVGALAWNGDMLSSGSRDRFILQRDVRTPRLQSTQQLQHKSYSFHAIQINCISSPQVLNPPLISTCSLIWTPQLVAWEAIDGPPARGLWSQVESWWPVLSKVIRETCALNTTIMKS